MESEKKLAVIIEQSGLEATKAKKMLDMFKGYFNMAAEWEIKAKAIIVTSASQTADMQMARAGRLFLAEKRRDVEKTRKEMKEQSLREGKAIDGIANVLKALIVPIEQHLDKQEKFVQIKEKEEVDRKIIEAQEKIETERIAAEEREKKQQHRRNKMFELGLKWDGQSFIYKDINFHFTDLIAMQDDEFEKACSGAAQRKQQTEKEEEEKQEALRLENKRLENEVIEKERLAIEERERQAAILAKADEEKRAIEEKARKEKEEAEAEKKRQQDEIDEQKRKAAELENQKVECPHCHKKFIPTKK